MTDSSNEHLSPDRQVQATLTRLIKGPMISRCLVIAAELAIPDLLRDGPRSIADLAAETDTDPDALYRLLRVLAQLEVFVEHEDRRFENGALAHWLRSDVPGSMRAYARLMGTKFHWRALLDLEHSIRTGRSALEKAFPGLSPFEILAEHTDAQELFSEAMTDLSRTDRDAITASYDFSRFDRIVDVGGGYGEMAAGIAQSAPGAHLTVLDLPHVIEGTKGHLASLGLGDRVEAVAGDFFEAVPGPADLCVMKHILHDWDDERCRVILENCRRILEPDGRILICELLVTSGPGALSTLLFDLEMLLGPGGRERTEEEFRRLFESAGLRWCRTLETPAPIRLVEAAVATS